MVKFIKTDKVIGISASLAIALGLILAVYPIQGWIMPTPLAITILSILFIVVLILLSALFVELYKASMRWLEYRATSAPWVITEPPGVFDCTVDAKRATDRLIKEFMQVQKDTTRLSRLLTMQAAQLEKIAIPSGKTFSPKDQLKIANNVGKGINKSAIYFEKRANLFETLIKEIIRDYEVLIPNLDVKNQNDKSAMEHYKLAFTSFDRAGNDVVMAIINFRQASEAIIRLNMSRMARTASQRLINALDILFKCFNQFQSDSQRLHKALETKLASVDSLILDKEDSQK